MTSLSIVYSFASFLSSGSGAIRLLVKFWVFVVLGTHLDISCLFEDFEKVREFFLSFFEALEKLPATKIGIYVKHCGTKVIQFFLEEVYLVSSTLGVILHDRGIPSLSVLDLFASVYITCQKELFRKMQDRICDGCLVDFGMTLLFYHTEECLAGTGCHGESVDLIMMGKCVQ